MAVRWVRARLRLVEPGVNLQQLIREQDGLITREQARSTGLTDAAIDHRLAVGLLDRVRPGVLLSREHRLTERARLRADALWLGAGATMVGTSAAWWWHLIDDPPTVARFAVPPQRRVRSRSQTALERREIAGRCRVAVDGVMVTSRACTVVDAVRELGLERGADVMDRALLDGRVTLDGLRRAHADAIGRWGSPTIARLLRLAAGGARFEAERQAHRLLRAEKITGWVADHEIRLTGYGPAVLDLAFPGLRIVVEVDGWAYHRDLRAFLRDARRQNALAGAGWTVLRTNWYELRESPGTFLVSLRDTIARRVAEPMGRGA